VDTITITVREAIAAHDQWLQMRRSDGTRAKYAALLKPFEKEFGERPLASLTTTEIELGYLARYSSKKVATQRNHISALRSLFACAERFDWIGANPMRKIESPSKQDEFQGFLSSDQDAAVQAACVTPQERALVMLLRYTGLRVSEACDLLWDDVDLEGGRLLPSHPALIVRKSKTRAGQRTVPLPPLLVTVLKTWRKRNTSARFVLETRNGTPMLPQFAHRLVVRVGQRVDVKVSPHALRRTYGSAALNAGVRIEAVSAALGHANVAVTHKSYARLSADRLADELMAVTGS
jgi:integrase/recombinase XerD